MTLHLILLAILSISFYKRTSTFLAATLNVGVCINEGYCPNQQLGGSYCKTLFVNINEFSLILLGPQVT